MHFKCSISTIFVNKTLKFQKSIKMKRVQAMAVTGRVQNVDLDLDLYLDAGYNQLWSKCTKIIIKVFGQLYLGEIDTD